MKNPLLIPNKYKVIGWIIFLSALASYFINTNLEWQPAFLDFTFNQNDLVGETNLLKEILFTLGMIGLFMISFAKEKQEDEYVSFLRLKCWQYAAIISMVISLFGTLGIYGMRYLTFAAFNMLTVPVVFIVLFSINLYKLRKASNEK